MAGRVHRRSQGEDGNLCGRPQNPAQLDGVVTNDAVAPGAPKRSNCAYHLTYQAVT
jgi:hypothetical protein